MHISFHISPVTYAVEPRYSILPVMLQSTLDPLSQGTRMGTLRAEAMRTAIGLGFARAGDRVITVDRTVGKPQDMHLHSYNMKMSTLKQ